MKVTLVSRSQSTEAINISLSEIPSYVARHGVVKEDNGRLLKYLLKHKHWSPLEHIFFTFQAETSRAISAQIFRHRSMHFQELSQRYDEISELEPIEFRMRHENNRQSSTAVVGELHYDTEKMESVIEPYEGAGDEVERAIGLAGMAIDEVFNAYNKLIEAGVAKETARMILPMGSRTKIHISGTLRDLLAFLNIRLDDHTQKEARLIAIEIAKVIADEMPEVAEATNNFNDYKGLFM